MQLELLPITYYNTLGFEKEIIGYINFVDDSIVEDILPDIYKAGGKSLKV